MIEIMLANAPHPIPEILPGQATYLTPGTYQWVCPEEVTEVNVLVMGPGQAGSVSGLIASGGRGGAVRWRNRISVTPGVSYGIVVATAGGSNPAQTPNNITAPQSSSYAKSSAFGLLSGNYDQGSILVRDSNNGGGNGGLPSTASGSSGATAYGGAAARFDTDGQFGVPGYSGGTDVKTGQPTSRIVFSAGISGGGGIGIPAASNAGGNNAAFLGAHGAVRIIWGTGRRFPTTRITDE